MFLLRDDISEIADILKKGGLICYPTDTVWAVGCDATNPEAIARLNELKGGVPEKGYVVLVDSIDMLKAYVPKVHPRLETLLSFHQRPLTLVFDKISALPAPPCAPNGSAAIRVSTDEFCKTLIAAFGKPIIGTIAAKIGVAYPPTFGAVSSEILGSVNYVVKYRQDDKTASEPSAIAKLDRHNELEFLRD